VTLVIKDDLEEISGSIIRVIRICEFADSSDPDAGGVKFL
jgi:hypothetical protein